MTRRKRRLQGVGRPLAGCPATPAATREPPTPTRSPGAGWRSSSTSPTADHPETANALQLGLPAIAPTTSFATSDSNGLHAFALVDADGNRVWGRYSWKPDAGVEHLTPEQLESADRDYLETELCERLASGPIGFTLEFTLAAEGDSLTDPTEAWEGEREVVTLGRLEVTAEIEDAEADGPMVWDPMNLTEGIEPSEDEILAARPPAYSVSIERRTA